MRMSEWGQARQASMPEMSRPAGAGQTREATPGMVRRARVVWAACEETAPYVKMFRRRVSVPAPRFRSDRAYR